MNQVTWEREHRQSGFVTNVTTGNMQYNAYIVADTGNLVKLVMLTICTNIIASSVIINGDAVWGSRCRENRGTRCGGESEGGTISSNPRPLRLRFPFLILILRGVKGDAVDGRGVGGETGVSPGSSLSSAAASLPRLVVAVQGVGGRARPTLRHAQVVRSLRKKIKVEKKPEMVS